MNRCLIIVAESSRAGFRSFFAPLTGLVKGGVKGIHNEYRAIERDYERRIRQRLKEENIQ